MHARDLISDVIPALKTSDTGLQALNWMEVFRISHLPIVNDKEFLGLISDSDIYDLNMADNPIGAHGLSLHRPFVFEDQHFFEIIQVVSSLHLSVVPVLDRKNHYKGVISLINLVQHFDQITSVQNLGGIIVLELNIHDYALSEIAQIVESNDAKILSLYITSPPDSTRLELTIKVNVTNITAILQTFERYAYHIKSSYTDNELMEDFFDDRYDAFLNYLNV